MIKTKLSSTTCKVLLGMSLALSASNLYAAKNVDSNATIKENFEKKGNSFSYKGTDYDIALGNISTQGWDDDDTKAPTEETSLFDEKGTTKFKNFNAKDEKISIDAGEKKLTLSTTGADTLNNFTLTSTEASADAIKATGINFRATSGSSVFNGNTSLSGGTLIVDGGSINVNGALALANTKLAFNADRLSAIQVKGNANLGTLATGSVLLSSKSIQSFNNAVLVNVTGQDEKGVPFTLQVTGLDTANVVGAKLQVDDRTYITDNVNLNTLSGVAGKGATGGVKEGDRVSFADYVNKNFSNVVDLGNLVEYTLNTNETKDPVKAATQLRISGGASTNALDSKNLVAIIQGTLDRYINDAGNTGLLKSFADDNKIEFDLTKTDEAKMNEVEKAAKAIQAQRAALANITAGKYTENRVVNGRNTPFEVTLLADRAAYEALSKNNAAGVDKAALKYTRNDVFVQNIGNIQRGNQAIVARYLDGLEMSLRQRTNNAGQTYNNADLHTQDVGNVARQGDILDKDGNKIGTYDNGATLDAIARIKLENLGNTLANEFRESAKSIANTNSAVSTVNSVINTANDVAIGSRIAMLNNPYGSYASKMSELKFAAVASDMGANYVDSYSNGIWANVFGGANIIDGDTGGLYGLSLGFDKQATDNVLIGGYFTYAYAEIKDNSLSQESNNFQLGLYSSIQVAPLWELNLKAYGQVSPTDQSRWDVLGNYDSDFTRKSFGLSANIGRSFGFQEDTFIVKPFVGANYYLTLTPDYKESGAAGLNIDSSTNNTLSLDLGAEFRKYFNEESYFFITPKVEQYVLNNGGDFEAALAGIALPSVDGADKNKTYGQVIIGGNFNLSKQFSANIGLGVKQILAGKVDSKNETYATGQLGFKYKF
ncbi:autotransporter outer membrane beta-barrel domain-containing protein [Campylobacter cuniculorum]|uniref:Autotransporter domain protein n=2 Tax=Campylobacter cuniculorum TaxID=374106 RepID=A0A1W6BXJ4_9BACT|nr:autotransporter outer membrane beta-barrel domain-containing protein [Campylobacter cuniculorum]ARJ56787.1 autotransporter domain protein [Campylobacter cuniculorum DSM 23162 = LMG 24588]